MLSSLICLVDGEWDSGGGGVGASDCWDDGAQQVP